MAQIKYNLGNLGKEVYSTDETIIGTWIDGKPLYRKVLLCTTNTQLSSPQSGGDWKNVPGWSETPPNINEYVDIRNSSLTVSKRIDHMIQTDNSLKFYSLNSAIVIEVGSPLIIEYTKTTD